ncbi:MAG: type II secretion system F family protein [Paracoccaceae bacterium]
MTPETQAWLQAAAYAGMFLGALAAFEGLRQLASRGESGTDARNRRMRLIARGATAGDLVRLLKPHSRAGGVFAKGLFAGLPAALRQAGLSISPAAFLGLAALAATAAAGALASLLPLTLAVPAGIAAGGGLPFALVAARRRKRMDALVRQLPEALDLMARGLRVGHPVNATVAAVAKDMPDPVAAEFGHIVDQVAYGATLADAFLDFADRLDTEDARYLAVSVAIQHGTGGDLAQVLSTLARVIRDRAAMRRRIKAISAEGRLTSTFLSALPLFILAATSVTAPGYYTGVMDDPLFRPFAVTVGVLIVANFLAMRRLVNFRI